jgi:NAD(P)-dependent dehydrogenase (short-subunit alcohol dehydrogenase family)
MAAAAERSRTVAISGSASGIGAATAELLRSAGRRVIGIDLHDAEVVADLATPGGRSRAIAEVHRKASGRLDGLALCAGVAAAQPDGHVVSVNYFGAQALLRGLRPDLEAGFNPAAVVIASSAIVFGRADSHTVDRCLAGDEPGALAAAAAAPRTGYASAKLALSLEVRRRAVDAEWLGRGITLNAVAPGVVRTPMTAPLIADPAWVPTVPNTMGRYAEASELAGVLAFFLGPHARYITGQVLFVDGGAEAGRHFERLTARSVLES